MKAFAATALVATAAVFAADSAQAASSNTYFGGSGGVAHSYHFTADDGTGITATATSNGNTAKVGQYRFGLGVTSWEPKKTNCGIMNKDAHFVDGKGSKETLWLSFDSKFVVEGLLFTYADKNDDVRLINGDTSETIGSYSLAHNFLGLSYLDLTGVNLSTNKLGIAAYGSNDDFKVKGVKGHAVPTPSAALAGLVGLIGLAARRRRPSEVEAA